MKETRLNSNLKTIAFVFGLLVLSATVLTTTFYLAEKYLSPNKDTKKTALGAVKECGSPQKLHSVTIQNDKMIPLHTDALLCDKLTITNTDNKLRYIAFGVHDKHITYDGITEINIKKDESFTVTLNQSGTYTFHDHNQEEVEGSFTVAN